MKRFKHQKYLNYAVITDNVVSEMGVSIKSVKIDWSHDNNILSNLIINSIHAFILLGSSFIHSSSINDHFKTSNIS